MVYAFGASPLVINYIAKNDHCMLCRFRLLRTLVYAIYAICNIIILIFILQVTSLTVSVTIRYVHVLIVVLECFI